MFNIVVVLNYVLLSDVLLFLILGLVSSAWLDSSGQYDDVELGVFSMLLLALKKNPCLVIYPWDWLLMRFLLLQGL